jgi:RNA polymerase sigma factor (sigma-70 family)
MSPGLSDVMLPLASPFATTHWSVVMCARQEGTPAGAHALERLCQTYWPPLYAYVRRSGHSPPDAQDLTQSFFERLLTEGRFGFAERGKGRFRTFLLSSLKHFMVNEWRRSTRIKRGSGLAHVPIDCSTEEDAYVHEPIDRASPEAVYERRWATRLLEEVITALRRDYERTGQGQLFDSILPVMWGDPDGSTYQEVAERVGSSEGAVKIAVHRIRARFRQRIRDAVAATVQNPLDADEVDSELEHLQRVLQHVVGSSH